MNKIITKEPIEKFYDDQIATLKEKLHHEHDVPRGISVNVIGLRLNENYAAYSKLLLAEMQENIHFNNVRLGIKTAWNIAVVLAENLKEADYPKLKTAFGKWDKTERTNLLDWLKDFPDQRNILEKGHV